MDILLDYAGKRASVCVRLLSTVVSGEGLARGSSVEERERLHHVLFRRQDVRVCCTPGSRIRLLGYDCIRRRAVRGGTDVYTYITLCVCE